jgi:hypothetical protein
VIYHFHFIFGKVIHSRNTAEQVKAKFIAERNGDFEEILFGDNPAIEAGTTLKSDNVWESGGQVSR